MKVKKTLFSILIAVGVGAVATTTITSCSTVDSAITENMVDPTEGKGSFSKDMSLDEEINAALTDKSATDAFKKSVVNKILTRWYQKLVDADPKGVYSSFASDLKKMNTDIDTDWDNQVKSSKDTHKGNWQYYFQNETLNPTGGTKATWREAQLESKIRSYFDGKFLAQNYLSVPSKTQTSSSYDTNRLDLDIVDSSYIDTNIDSNLGTTKITNPASLDKYLNPDWWPMIGFYATANTAFARETDATTRIKKFQDYSYALIQRTAWNEYTQEVAPISATMALWNYSLGDKKDLSTVYNTKLLGGGDDIKTGYTLPYFGYTSGSTKLHGPDQKFYNFFTDGKTAGDSLKYFLYDRGNGSNAADQLGISNINFASGDYTDDPSADLTLINRNDMTKLYSTFSPEILNLFNNKMLPDNNLSSEGYITDQMPILDVADIKGTDSIDDYSIMKNFLFKDPQSTNSTSVDRLPSSYYVPVAPDNAAVKTTKPGVLDLASIYENDNSGTSDHIRLFANIKDDATINSAWYSDGARYVVSAVQLKKGTNLLPYIMIRNESGVHIEGIDGFAYLNQTNNSKAPDTDLGVYPTGDNGGNWRPGDPWSQERENQLLKYRTIYENVSGSTKVYGAPLGIISGGSNGSAATGLLPTYLTSNEDTIILDVVNQVINNPDLKELNILGLADFDTIKESSTWNDNLYKLVKSFDALNQFEAIIAQYDTANKAIFAWGDTYRANEVTANIENAAGGPKEPDVYKNGLAQALPVKLVSGVPDVPTADGTFNENMITNYPVVYDTLNKIWTKDVSDAIKAPPLHGYKYSTLVNDIVSKSKSWSNSLANKVGYNENAYDKDFHANYSENVISNNDYINAMLWSFGSSANFSNSEKTAALTNYIGTFDYSGYDNAIASMYISGQLIGKGSAAPLLTSYQNTQFDKNNADPVDTYAKLLTNEWKYQMTMDRGGRGAKGILNVSPGTEQVPKYNFVAQGYDDKAISYDTLIASIKYETSNNYENFVKWLGGKISLPQYSNNIGYLVWMTKDNQQNYDGSKSSFNQPDTATTGTPAKTVLTDALASQLYGWHTNYDGLFENRYQNTNSDAVDNPSNNNTANVNNYGTKTYTAFDQYWQFAKMPLTKNNDVTKYTQAMGFMGLQTYSSNTLSADVKTALFDQFKDTCDSVSGAGIEKTGSLYAYGKETTLVNAAEGCSTPADVTDLANYIQKQTGNFQIAQEAIANEQNHPTDPEKTVTQNMIDVLKEYIIGNTNAGITGIPDNYYYGYNINNKVTTPTLELKTTNSDSYNFKDDDKINSSRYRVMQLNHEDITPTGNDYNSVVTKLETMLGPDLVKNLVVQAAMDSSEQSDLITVVIKTAYGTNGRIVVYDRRFNDQLGSSWVKDWKIKN